MCFSSKSPWEFDGANKINPTKIHITFDLLSSYKQLLKLDKYLYLFSLLIYLFDLSLFFGGLAFN